MIVVLMAVALGIPVAPITDVQRQRVEHSEAGLKKLVGKDVGTAMRQFGVMPWWTHVLEEPPLVCRGITGVTWDYRWCTIYTRRIHVNVNTQLTLKDLEKETVCGIAITQKEREIVVGEVIWYYHLPAHRESKP